MNLRTIFLPMKTPLYAKHRQLTNSIRRLAHGFHIAPAAHVLCRTIQRSVLLVQRVQILKILTLGNMIKLILSIKTAPFIQTLPALGRIARFANHDHILRCIFSPATPRQQMFNRQVFLFPAINTPAGYLHLLNPLMY